MYTLITIWLQPQKTLEDVLENKSSLYSCFILFLVSISFGLTLLLNTEIFNEFTLLTRVLIVSGLTFGGILVGWMLHAAFCQCIGKILGGSGGFKGILRVTPVGMIPFIAMIPLNIILAYLYGMEIITDVSNSHAITSMSDELLYTSILLMLATSIFSVSILSKGIGMVHQFSSLRGFGTIVLTSALFIVLSIIFLSTSISYLITFM